MLAIFKTGGKQYSVKTGQILKVEKLEGKKGESGEKEEIFKKKEYGKQIKRQTINKQTKCYFYENRKCTKGNCQF